MSYPNSIAHGNVEKRGHRTLSTEPQLGEWEQQQDLSKRFA